MSGCGGSSHPSAPRAALSATPTHTPRPQTSVVEGDGDLAVGITEPNPNFFWADSHPAPEPAARWRSELAALHPAYYRIVVDWAQLQPDPAKPPNFDLAQTGCSRDPALPCAPWGGLREQLRALASRQKDGGWEALVVLWGTPTWAAEAAHGCERGGTQPRSRAPRADAMAAYAKFAGAVMDLADKEGAQLRYWSPWNEPNHPFGLSPQRASCSSHSPSVAIAPYVRMARALRGELRAHGGARSLVLGELAGLRKLKPRYTRISEFLAGLPRDLVCAAPVFGQHGYVGGPDPVGDVARAVARFKCPVTPEIWMTETGSGAARRNQTRATSGAAQRHACHKIHFRLKRWYEDPRVSAAFQYTFREDPVFPTGLVTPSLQDAYPALREWQAWGRRSATDSPAPADACGGT